MRRRLERHRSPPSPRLVPQLRDTGCAWLLGYIVATSEYLLLGLVYWNLPAGATNIWETAPARGQLPSQIQHRRTWRSVRPDPRAGGNTCESLSSGRAALESPAECASRAQDRCYAVVTGLCQLLSTRYPAPAPPHSPNPRPRQTPAPSRGLPPGSRTRKMPRTPRFVHFGSGFRTRQAKSSPTMARRKPLMARRTVHWEVGARRVASRRR